MNKLYPALSVRYCSMFLVQFSLVQSLSRVRLFATPWNVGCQAFLSITNSRSSPKLMSIEWWCHPAISSSVIPFSSCPQSLPASESFPMSQLLTMFKSSHHLCKVGTTFSTPILQRKNLAPRLSPLELSSFLLSAQSPGRHPTSALSHPVGST